MKASLRIISLILIAVLLLGAMPAAFAEGPSSVEELMAKFDERVQAPKESSILAEEEEFIVISDYRSYICALTRPGSGVVVAKIEEGATVVACARQRGYVLAVEKGGTAGGWMNEALLEKVPADGVPTPRMRVADVMSHFRVCVQRPPYSAVLSEPERMVVESTHGYCIYAMTNPVDCEKIADVPEGSTVIVYAKMYGWVLGALEDDSIGGWMSENLLVPEDDEASGNGKERAERIDELMKGFDSVIQRPKKSCLLDEPVKMQIRASYGKLVYAMSRVATGVRYKVTDGSTVTVYARQGGFALIKTDDGSVGGWINEKFLTPCN